jgi:DNA helicase-2/ATP-dependent DNA helicase PcrA
MPARRFSGAPAASPAFNAPKPKSTSTGSVLSFFKDAPVQFDPSAINAAKQSEAPRAELKRGVRVRHEQFGDGTILTMEGSGPDAKLTVYFERVGSKKFIARFAKLTRI